MKKSTLLLLSLQFLFLKSFAVFRISSSVIKTTEDGLCNSIVTSITQDKNGFIWIGTEEGLSKYDGLSFKTFKNNSADSSKLANNSVVSLLCDKSGRIWVGTYEGCQVYDEKLNLFQQIDLNLSGFNKKAVKIEKIFQDSKGNVWLSTSIHGAIMIPPSSSRNKHFYFQPNHPLSICSNIITDIAEDRQGNIWFASSDKGISVYNPTQNTVKHYNRENGALPSNQVLRLIKSDNNIIYLSILRIGLVKYDASTNAFNKLENVNSKIPSKIIFSLSQDAQNNLLLGTDGDGLIVYNTINQAVYHHPVFVERFYELRKSRVHSIYTDKQNNIWIGIPTLGICLIKQSNAGFHTYRNFDDTPFHDCINGVFMDNEQNILMASDGGGLIVFNRLTNFKKQFIHQQNNPFSIPDNAALDVFVDNRQNTWVATYTGGVSMMNKFSGKFSSYNTENTNGGIKSNNIRTITQSKDGRIWIGTHGGGITCIDLITKTFTNFSQNNSTNSLINNWVNKLHFDKKGRLWIGTVYGLSCFNIETAKFKNYSTQSHSKMSNNMIHAIADDNNGKIWFGTDDGLNCLDPETNEIQVFTTENNLISNRIKGLVFTGNSSLWLSDNQGISCFDTYSHNVKSFNMQDGLQSDEFNSGAYRLSASGEVLFGGTKGINAFHPKMINGSKPANTIILTDLKLYDQQVVINRKVDGRIILPQALRFMKEIDLSYSDKSITIEFSTPEYFAGKKLIVSSYLNGFDTKWRNLPAGSRSVTYTNLSPGTYTLHLKTGLANGILDGNETKLTIVVHPPYWKSWWAYSIYWLLLGISIYFTLRFIKNKNALKDKERLKELEIKKQEEIYLSKLVFFTNISHEFRTPLTLISSPLERLLQKETNEEKIQLLQIVRKNAERLLNLINQILDLRKLDMKQMKVHAKQISIANALKEIIDTFMDVASQKNIEITFENKIQDTTVWFDPDMFEKCMYNIFSNAVKFTDKGYIAVSTDFEKREDTDYIVIHVTDTGIGMPSEVTDKIFDRYYQYNETDKQHIGSGIGLNLVKNIMELHKGIVNVKSELNEGSTFSLFIPLGDINKNTDNENNTINDRSSELKPNFILETSNIQSTNVTQSISNNKPIVLIVDDNSDMRTMLHVELKSEYKIVEASDGFGALEKIQSKTPDLIITDVMMPHMDGIELCKKLKSDMDSSHIPIIILTAKSEMEDRIIGIDLGVEAYITKPFNMSLLRSQVKSLLEQRQKLKKKFSHSINWEIESGVLTSADDRLMERVFEIIKTNLDNPALSVEMISKELKISRAQLHRKMKGIIDQTPVDLIRTIRMNHAASLLTTTTLTVSEVAYAVGYNSQSYFSSSFSEFFGKTPSQYQKGGSV